MNLSEWLKAERGRGAGLARTLGIKQPQVADWVSGDKRVPISHCAAIEAATHGAVRRWDLRPTDWWRIWPELVGVAGAPVVSSSETQEV